MLNHATNHTQTRYPTFEETLRKITFWTYSKREISDLIKPFSELFNSSDLTRDYENVWEWIEGSSSELKSKINISREHDWEKGKYDKPLILTFDYKGFNKNKIVDNIGKKLANEFESDVNFGKIHILKNDKYEQNIDQIFRTKNI